MQDVSFTLQHMDIAGLAMGDPSKPMILALHGWLDNAASFIPLAPYLRDYYVLALDLPGHGLSSHRPIGSHYHLMDFVYDLHELIEQQQWHDILLVGHSMGGIIATLYASCFHERVKKLVSIESFGPMSKDAQSSAQQLRDSIENRLKSSRSPTQHPSSFERTVEARAKAGEMSLDAARLLMARNLYQQDGHWYFRTDRRLRTFSSLRITEEQVEAFMRAVQCPMLVILGDQGFESMRTSLQNRLTWVATLEKAHIAGHHHLHMDNPQEVATKLTTFLTNIA
jgi:pimeloyl-ACP methyl ester carboxylesterase